MGKQAPGRQIFDLQLPPPKPLNEDFKENCYRSASKITAGTSVTPCVHASDARGVGSSAESATLS